jgi:hypothetical protein
MNTELSKTEKVIAGILLVLLTSVPAILIVAFWPDRLAGPKEFIKPLYYNQLFHVRLAGICDTISYGEAAKMYVDTITKIVTDTGKNAAPKKATAQTATANTTSTKDSDSIKETTAAQTVTKTVVKKAAPDTTIYIKKGKCICVADESKFIHINTLLLLLVALAGFLGNMIHIATSFTTYVGSNKFVRSWLLWYAVKPFTAAALAVGVYFVFRGGFLNTSDDTTNINLYGVMTMAVLTGLFTDRATQKLKEVFEVLFRPKEERADPLDGKPKVTAITPAEIEMAKENIITITGENLQASAVTATINNEAVTLSDTSNTSSTIKYTIPDSQKNTTTFNVVVKDAAGNVAGTATLALKNAGAQTPQTKDEETGDTETVDDAGSETNSTDETNVKE